MAKLFQNCLYIVKTQNSPSLKLSNLTKNLNLESKRTLIFTRKSKPPEDPYIIVRPTSDDTKEILDLMWSSFYPYEPCTRSLGLGYKRNCVFDEQARQVLSKGYSIIAKCKHDGCIVGVALNDSTCPWDPDMLEKFACTLKDENISQLLLFWAHLQRAPKLWDKYCQLNIFEIAYLFVRPEDRRKRIAERLVKASRDLGADAGFNVIRVDAMTFNAARICEKVGMRLVHEIPYCSYITKNQEVVFKVPSPDLVAKTFVDTPHFKHKH